MKNKNKRSGRQKTNRGSEVSESSSAVGSVKNTTEEVTVVSGSGMEVAEASGSWQKGNGRGLECPLTCMSPPLLLSCNPLLSLDLSWPMNRPRGIRLFHQEQQAKSAVHLLSINRDRQKGDHRKGMVLCKLTR